MPLIKMGMRERSLEKMMDSVYTEYRGSVDVLVETVKGQLDI